MNLPLASNQGECSRVVAVLQPSYLPWLGYFDQLARSDVFVYYDDVQFDKHGWRNRNRICTPDGPQWLTVPIRHKGHSLQLINETVIDSTKNWTRKHLRTLAQHYRSAPFWEMYFPELEHILSHRWNRLVDLNIALIEQCANWLGIRTPRVCASTLGITGGQNSRLVSICHHFHADTYLSGASAKNYLDVGLFLSSGIKVVWQNYLHPVYPQIRGKFTPYLSIIDLLFNVGPHARQFFSPFHASDREKK